MEVVATRNIVLAGSAVVLLGLLAMLLMKVKASPEHKVSQADLARAAASHKRSDLRAAERDVVKSTFNPGPVRRRAPKSDDNDDAARAQRRPPFDSPGGFVGRHRDNARDRARKLSARIATNNEPSAGLKQLMDAANKHYDRGDYESALQNAMNILKENPNNIRMLRIVVSSSCIMGEGDQARDYAKRLPQRDKKQLAGRCQRYQIEL